LAEIPSDTKTETMSAAATSNTLVTSGPASNVVASEIILPAIKTLTHATRIALEQDKPIMLDYFQDTLDGKAFIGEDNATKEKMLVRSAEEYTSLIQKIFRVETDFIVLTENSIYIISGSTKKKSISAPTA